MLDKIIKDRSIIYLQSTQLGCKDVEIRKIKLVTVFSSFVLIHDNA